MTKRATEATVVRTRLYLSTEAAKKRWIPIAIFCFCLAQPTASAQSSGQMDKVDKYFSDIPSKYPNLNKPWKVPGKISTPGAIQEPGKIQTPSPYAGPTGLKAIKQTSDECMHRFTIGSDALFEFDKSALTEAAKETLNALAPLLEKENNHPVVVEGHTDSIGADQYNQELSEKRAERVKNWLLENHAASPAQVSIVGYGKNKPLAPNTKKDGSDNPAGRALNRRVEISVDTCKTIDGSGSPVAPAPPAP